MLPVPSWPHPCLHRLDQGEEPVSQELLLLSGVKCCQHRLSQLIVDCW